MVSMVVLIRYAMNSTEPKTSTLQAAVGSYRLYGTQVRSPTLILLTRDGPRDQVYFGSHLDDNWCTITV